MTPHDKAHYSIGLSALALGLVSVAALIAGGREMKKIEARAPVTVVHEDKMTGFGFAEAAPKPHAGTWPGLGETKTIALGEALRGLVLLDASGPVKVVVFCTTKKCEDLEADLDDAFQIAGWTDDEESQVIVGPDEDGILVGPPGPAADALMAGLAAAGVGPAKIGPMNTGASNVGVIIAKRPK